MASVRLHVLSFAVAATLVVTGCGDDTTTNPPAAPTFTELQTTIFTPTCAVSGCHLGDTAQLGLDLSAGKAYANLVGKASVEVPVLNRVTANNADSSYLVIKLEGSPRMAPGTSRMPLVGGPLTAEQITKVREWIAAGAKND
jgi:hypothetical protein